jgi:TonB family protein
MATRVRQLLMIGLLAIVTGGVMTSAGLAAEPDGSRKTTRTVAPIYPDSARKMQLTGTVRLSALVAADGWITSAEVLGGHPILAEAAMKAAKKWKYQAAARESREVLVFAFAP